MRGITTIVLGISSAVCLNGCTADGGGPLGIVALDPNRHIAAAEPLFGKDDDICLDRPEFLLSIYSAYTVPPSQPVKTPTPPPPKVRPDNPCDRLRMAIAGALPQMTWPQPNSEQPRYSQLQRNEIIDAMIAASNRKCGRYVAFLQQYDGNINTFFGITSQAAAVIATIATAGTAKWFAAGSGIASGARDNFNQSHFANQTIGVLATAFQKERTQIRSDIDTREHMKPADYTLMHGMADVFYYHSACSIVEGLKTTQRAVENTEVTATGLGNVSENSLVDNGAAENVINGSSSNEVTNDAVSNNSVQP